VPEYTMARTPVLILIRNGSTVQDTTASLGYIDRGSMHVVEHENFQEKLFHPSQKGH
jgi:NADH:ubiquinone oxidoreductase subunit D